MVVPKINSAHGSDTRNIINAAIDSINVQGKSIQDLVAEGQLTPEEYARLLELVNNMADEIVVDNKLDTKRDKEVAIRLADLHTDVKNAMTGGSVAVVGENAVGKENIKDSAVTEDKINDGISAKINRDLKKFKVGADAIDGTVVGSNRFRMNQTPFFDYNTIDMIDIFVAKPGKLTFKVMSMNENGTFKVEKSFICIAQEGINTFVDGYDFNNINVKPGWYLGVFAEFESQLVVQYDVGTQWRGEIEPSGSSNTFTQTGHTLSMNAILKENSVTKIIETVPDIFHDKVLLQNLFDKDSAQDNAVLNTADGTTREHLSYAVSSFIPVEYGKSYTLYSGRVSDLLAFYDANKNRVGRLKGTSSDSPLEPFTFTIDNPAHFFVRININKSDVSLGRYMMVEGDHLPSEYAEYGTRYKLPQLYIGSENGGGTDTQTSDHAIARFQGKTLLVTGDSITEKNARAELNWHDYLSDWLSLGDVKNDGKGGSGLVKNNGINYRMANWDTRFGNNIDMIMVMGPMNDGTTNTYGDNTNGWDWIYGENDIFKDDWNTVPNETNMKSSLWMAMRYLLENLIAKYPNLPIGFIISQPRHTTAVKSGSVRNGYTTKSWGKNSWFEEWTEVIIEICGHYSIPVLDLYHQSGLRPWNAENNEKYFSSDGSPNGDGIHPNSLGQEIMAEKIYEFTKQYM